MIPQEELRFLILGAQREGNRMLAARLAPLGVTPSQAEALRCLAAGGAMTLRSLGQLLVCETGSPSRLVDTLVLKKLVSRREDPADRRQVLLDLSSVGKRVAKGVAAVEQEMYAWLAAQMSDRALSAGIASLRLLTNGTDAGAAIERRKSLIASHTGS